MLNTKLNVLHDLNKYENETIRWIDKGSHYELIFTDDFVTPSSIPLGIGRDLSLSKFGHNNNILTDIIIDMRKGDKSKEVHVFVGSFGGEVAALNMILQQLLTYDYRVGINLGTACSCGWMLLFACQERYVSPFSQAMYHDISCIHGGKHTELQRNAEFMGRWQKELLKITDTVNVLTEKELELGRTTEVWLTGQELIERGAAKDYEEYLYRRIPEPATDIMHVGGTYYMKTLDDNWMELTVSKAKTLTYAELVTKANSPESAVKDMLSRLSSQFEDEEESDETSENKTAEVEIDADFR